MMNRVNFGRLSGTIIDVCRGHGAFLDAGELHAIVTFITEGGLDRARQREKDDLEEERHRLALLKSQVESGARLPEWQSRPGLHDTLLESAAAPERRMIYSGSKFSATPLMQ